MFCGFFFRKERLEWNIVEECKQILGLNGLAKDGNITLEQMEACCRRLIIHSSHIGDSLQGCYLKVAMFYSVMSDGEICIPWCYTED